jgi:hypothetical protein
MSVGDKYYGSLLGIGLLLEDDFRFSDQIVFRPLKLDSDVERLKTRTRSQREYGLACAIAEAVTFEMEISAESPDAVATAIWNAQWILVLISIYIRSPLYWPLNGYRRKPQDKDFFLLSVTNFHFSNRIFAQAVPASASTLVTCAAHLAVFNEQLGDRRFLHAASVAATNYNEPKESVRVAALWSAIESLLGFDQELRFRISATIARLLESEKVSRYSRFRDVRKLYDLRSKSVHGAEIKHEDEETAVSQSLKLLCELLIFFIERGTLVSKAEMDEIIFE